MRTWPEARIASDSIGLELHWLVAVAAAGGWMHRSTVSRTLPAVPRDNQDRAAMTAADCCVRRV